MLSASLKRRFAALARIRQPRHPIRDLGPYPGSLAEVVYRAELKAGEAYLVKALIGIGRERCVYDERYESLEREHGEPPFDVRSTLYREQMLVSFAQCHAILRKKSSPWTPRPKDPDYRAYQVARQEIKKIPLKWRRKIWEQMFLDWIFPGDPPVDRPPPPEQATPAGAPARQATEAKPEPRLPATRSPAKKGGERRPLHPPAASPASSGKPSPAPPGSDADVTEWRADDSTTGAAGDRGSEARPPTGAAHDGAEVSDDDAGWEGDDDARPPRLPLHPLIDANGRLTGPLPKRYDERREVLALIRGYEAEKDAWDARQREKRLGRMGLPVRPDTA